jgi:phytanoyl-CoA hydroxylase
MTSARFAEFREQGFVHVRSLFSRSEIATIRNALGAFQREQLPALPRRFTTLRHGDVAQVCKIDCLDLHAPFFGELLRSPRMLDLAAELLGEAVGCQFLHFQNSLPHRAGEVMAHQDAFGPNFDPPLSLNLWLSLGDYGERDGCLRYLRESHRGGYQPDLYGPLPNPRYEESREVAMVTSAGDVLAHDSFTVHRSGMNHGTADRWALIFGYHAKASRQLGDDEWLAKYGGNARRAAPLGRPYEAAGRAPD